MELKNDYELKKVLIETKMQEENRELEQLKQKKMRIEQRNLESSSVFSPFFNTDDELNQINEFIEIKEQERIQIREKEEEIQKKQIQIQHLQTILNDWANQEYKRNEWNNQKEVHKNNQIITALNFSKQINHSIALQLKSIVGDLDSLCGVLQKSNQNKNVMDLLKQDISRLDRLTNYLHSGITDSIGIVEAMNQFIQQKAKDSAIRIIFNYEEQVEEADIRKKYFVKQIIEYLFSIVETIQSLSKVELHLLYESGQYHMIIRIDSYSSEAVETYPMIDQLTQAYDGLFSIKSDTYGTQFDITI